MKRKEERCVRFVITVVTGQRHLIFYSDHIVGIGIGAQWHCIKIATRSFISQLGGHLPIGTGHSAKHWWKDAARPIIGMLLARAHCDLQTKHLANVYKADQNLDIHNHGWATFFCSLSDDSDWPYLVYKFIKNIYLQSSRVCFQSNIKEEHVWCWISGVFAKHLSDPRPATVNSNLVFSLKFPHSGIKSSLRGALSSFIPPPLKSCQTNVQNMLHRIFFT